MNEIQIFNSPQFGDIRTATDDNNEPYSVQLMCARLSDMKIQGRLYQTI